MTHACGRLLAGLLLALLVAASTAAADPVTVNLRVEGPTKTLYEGTITTDVRPFHFTGSTEMHECAAPGAGGRLQPARGTAMAAAIDEGLEATGSWFDGLGPSFDTIAGESVAFDPATNRYLVEYDNGAVAMSGACSDPVADGEDVLFAYGDGSEIALSLAGPAEAEPGERVRVIVRNAADATPQAGATVGDATTNADGVATLRFSRTGTYTLKATKPGAIRSNAVTVCVHDGDRRGCPAARDATISASVASVRNGRAYPAARAPRELRGRVTGAGTVASVELRLRRSAGARCWAFDGGAERFVKRGCRRDAPWFQAGAGAEWSYLLPARLKRGRYDLQVRASDALGNRSAAERVRFRVR